MSGNPSFTNLNVWQRAKDLAVYIYKVTDKGGLSKDYSLKDQLRRASVSIASNIAEGDERGTNKDGLGSSIWREVLQRRLELRP